jgi:hypothetical protein
MENLEEALRNIDIFCRTLVKKIVENEDCPENMAVEPIENLLRRKYIKEKNQPGSLAKHLIPLPHAEETLIDIFEDDKYVRILMQCRCEDKRVKINTDVDGLEICAEECGNLTLPVKHLQIENMIARCRNNEIFEIKIPKRKKQ